MSEHDVQKLDAMMEQREPFGIEIVIRRCESGLKGRDAQAVAARLRERTSNLAKATERIVALEAEIARLREERKPVGWCVQAAAGSMVYAGTHSPISAPVLIQCADEAYARMLATVYGHRVLAIVEADAKEPNRE